MAEGATHDDARLILELYDLRREPRMREARNWFSSHCRFRSLEEFEEACPMGSEGSQYFWQVTTYWEMAASFVTSGALHKELLFENAGEMIFVWLRLEPLLPEMRESMHDPMMFSNLERTATEFAAWWSRRSPGAYDAMRKFVSAD